VNFNYQAGLIHIFLKNRIICPQIDLNFCRVATNLEKPGILWEFSVSGKFSEFCATSGKNYNE